MCIVHLLLIHHIVRCVVIPYCTAPSAVSTMFSKTRRPDQSDRRWSLLAVILFIAQTMRLPFFSVSYPALVRHYHCCYRALALAPALCGKHTLPLLLSMFFFLLLFSIRFGRSAVLQLSLCTFSSNTIYFENFFSSNSFALFFLLINFKTFSRDERTQAMRTRTTCAPHTNDAQTHSQAITFRTKSLHYKVVILKCGLRITESNTTFELWLYHVRPSTISMSFRFVPLHILSRIAFGCSVIIINLIIFKSRISCWNSFSRAQLLLPLAVQKTDCKWRRYFANVFSYFSIVQSILRKYRRWWR